MLKEFSTTSLQTEVSERFTFNYLFKRVTSFKNCSLNCTLTYLFPMHPFPTSWKHQKTFSQDKRIRTVWIGKVCCWMFSNKYLLSMSVIGNCSTDKCFLYVTESLIFLQFISVWSDDSYFLWVISCSFSGKKLL